MLRSLRYVISDRYVISPGRRAVSVSVTDDAGATSDQLYVNIDVKQAFREVVNEVTYPICSVSGSSLSSFSCKHKSWVEGTTTRFSPNIVRNTFLARHCA